ncbi:hypothetical protein BDR03DRAFT_983238 [Suillus americanus]|nr:hypothetical protein BDR03DRAFT_983238 [Suillus americanus]
MFSRSIKLRKQAVEEPSDDEEDKEHQAVQPCKRSHPPNKVYQIIGFYPHSWKDVLEAAKKKSHLGLVMSGTTFTCEAFINKTGIKYLMKTLEDFAADDIGVDAGFWDEHKHDMAIIIACLIAAAKYDILPADIYDDNKCEEHVCSQVQDLLDGGNFLHDGVDEQGRTNNLTNDVLREFCRLHLLQPLICKYETGIYKPTKFVSKLYQPIYDSVMQLYEAVKLDPYHSKKC